MYGNPYQPFQPYPYQQQYQQQPSMADIEQMRSNYDSISQQLSELRYRVDSLYSSLNVSAGGSAASGGNGSTVQNYPVAVRPSAPSGSQPHI